MMYNTLINLSGLLIFLPGLDYPKDDIFKESQRTSLPLES